MSKPTKIQTRILREMIKATPDSWYGVRRAARLTVPERTINTMIRNGWIREIDNATIEITPAGVRAYPVPLIQGASGRWYHQETGITLRRNPKWGMGSGYSGPRWQVERDGIVVNGDHYIDVARGQAQFMATAVLVERVRKADPATGAQWESGR